jgi:hypothetical protein
MDRRNIAHLFALLLVVCVSAFASVTTSRVLKIEINSGWGGLGKPESTRLIIDNDQGTYRLGDKRVDAALVQALISALNEPSIAEPQLDNLGITPEWLKEKAIPSAIKNAPNFANAAPNQKDLFVSSFSDPAVIEKVVPDIFHFVRTDDYPSAQVLVTFDDGSTLSAETHAWYEFMLPWKVPRDGNTSETFNADISRAVAALMPQKATNRYRIAGQGLDDEVADAVMEHIKAQWKLLGVENLANDTIALLRTEYVVDRADINSYHNVDYGLEWKAGQPREVNLDVTLRKQSFSENFSVEAILLYDNGKVYGVDAFFRRIGDYQELVNSVPWLTRFRQEYPQFPIQLTFVHDRSFSGKAMSVFVADMRIIGKQELADEVRSVQDHVALVQAGFGGYWLVLPDKTMILWRYSARAGLLKWTSTGVTTTRCSDYNGVSGGCVGAVVSPEGTLTQ